ncbi:D-2-hydroxyacid dehydrogenase family protein [Streptomyces sp. NPDC059247]|uniref:D-2-hydroxyacid dehydrogenase family protein n=1 Tax=Streptomyces sp. NPDC059247 TaxID=3346790 RepID=UPI0036786D53
MKLRCAVLDDYQGAALTSADWGPLADRVEVRVLREHLADRDALVAAVADCEVLVVMRERTPLDAALLERLPRLRLVVTSGMRNASVDVTAARARGITVCGTASGSEPPAELTWALLLGLARHVPAEARSLRGGGPWQSTVGADLAGRTLGLVGLGKIGARVARVGLAFGMEVRAWSPNLTEERAAEHGVGYVGDRRELFAGADFVSLHLVLSERTRGLVGEPELRAMRPHAYLVNTSRAGLVDGGALLRALREGWIAGAGLDVFETEPLPLDDPLRSLPNVLALPHLGYVTEGNYGRYFGQAVEDIEAFLAGTPVRELA